ncbi:unnamed protein product [Pleuronectes platessa]|uniref:Uncharacterized protein n=1 Tax=Pleuronectes platessa TaxID=8262 RepID=A0A9N7UEM8_PLEPL|nr:unnamed protein product [Pleuronectes platessa]
MDSGLPKNKSHLDPDLGPETAVRSRSPGPADRDVCGYVGGCGGIFSARGKNHILQKESIFFRQTRYHFLDDSQRVFLGVCTVTDSITQWNPEISQTSSSRTKRLGKEETYNVLVKDGQRVGGRRKGKRGEKVIERGRDEDEEEKEKKSMGGQKAV